MSVSNLGWLRSLGPNRSLLRTQENAPSTSGQHSNSNAKGSFRFWHEERRFKGSGERCIVQRALFEQGALGCLTCLKGHSARESPQDMPYTT